MPDLNPKIRLQSKGNLTAVVGGAAGFIGSHLCETLLEQNIRVIAIDNLTSSSKESIKPLLNNSHFTFFDFDLNTHKLDLGETQIDYVFHTAGLGESWENKDLSMETLLVNSLGTKNLLDLARAKKAKFLLVSSADIYNASLSANSLNYYYGRSSQDAQVLTHHEAKRYAEALVFEYFKNYDLDARICRVLDVYGPGMNFNSGLPLAGLIKEALNSDRLTIIGDGLQLLHPTYISDVIYGLIKAVLTDGTKGKIFQLINPEKITLLALTDEIKKAFAKSYSLQFRKDSSQEPFPYHSFELDTTTSGLNWHPAIKLIDGLLKTAAGHVSPVSAPVIPLKHDYLVDAPKKPKSSILKPVNFGFLKKKKKFVNRRSLKFTIFLASLALLLLGVFYPITSFFLSIQTGNSLLQKSLQELTNKNFSQAKVLADKAQYSWDQANQDLNNLTWLLTLFQLREKSAVWQEGIFTLSNFSQATSLVSGSFEPLILLANNWKNPQPNFHNYFISQMSQKTDNLALAADHLAVAEASMKQFGAHGPGFFTNMVNKLKPNLPRAKETVSALRGVVSMLPKGLGFEGEKNYLILFTDNSVIRTSGGLPINYLLGSVEDGHLNVVEKGSIESLVTTTKYTWPDEIKDLKKGQDPKIGDSLWSLNPKEAVKAFSDYFTSKGKNLDGVILADSNFWNGVGDLFKTKVNVSNFHEVISNFNTNDWEEFLNLAKTNLETKHVVAILNGEKTGSFLDDLNYSGLLLKQNEIAKKVANIGIPVADYQLVSLDSLNNQTTKVTYNQNYLISVSNQGLVEGKLTINIENKDKDPFQGYLRVLVPGGSVLEGSSESKEVLHTGRVGDKTQFSLPVDLQGSASKQVILDYRLPFQLSRTSSMSYSMVIQKQLGRGVIPFNLQVSVPENFTFDSLINFGSENKIKIDLNQDQTLTLLFKSKT